MPLLIESGRAIVGSQDGPELYQGSTEGILFNLYANMAVVGDYLFVLMLGATNDQYIWPDGTVGSFQDVIAKVDLKTMKRVDFMYLQANGANSYDYQDPWNSAIGGSQNPSLVSDGKYLYAWNHLTGDFRFLHKIDPKTMTEVSQITINRLGGYWDDPIVYGEDGFLYACFTDSEDVPEIDPDQLNFNRIYKIDPKSMSIVSYYEYPVFFGAYGRENGGRIWTDIVYHNGFVYANITSAFSRSPAPFKYDYSPGRTIKLDPETMTLVSEIRIIELEDVREEEGRSGAESFPYGLAVDRKSNKLYVSYDSAPTPLFPLGDGNPLVEIDLSTFSWIGKALALKTFYWQHINERSCLIDRWLFLTPDDSVIEDIEVVDVSTFSYEEYLDVDTLTPTLADSLSLFCGDDGFLYSAGWGFWPDGVPDDAVVRFGKAVGVPFSTQVGVVPLALDEPRVPVIDEVTRTSLALDEPWEMQKRDLDTVGHSLEEYERKKKLS